MIYRANIAFTTPNFISKEDAAAATEKDKKTSEETKNVDTETNEASQTTTTDKKSTTKSTETAAKPSGQKGLSIDADAKIRKSRAEIMSQNTVTISVSWTGGGQELKNGESSVICALAKTDREYSKRGLEL